SGPVEIEFAVNLHAGPREFAILQIRPYGAGNDFDQVDLEHLLSERVLAASDRALGNGIVAGIRDDVHVRPATVDVARTPELAAEIAAINAALRAERRHYLLIGPGRWGSSNTWLGIPVTWPQISSARVIVETCLDHFVVDPSQGSHFFHNLTSMGIAYLTVGPQAGGAGGDWA